MVSFFRHGGLVLVVLVCFDPNSVRRVSFYQYFLRSLSGIATLAFVIIQLWAVGVGSSATLNQIDNNDKDWDGKNDGSHDYDQNPWT